MKILYRKLSLLINAALIYSFTQAALAVSNDVMTCKVSGSVDYFIVYADQLIYSSDKFLHYQMIDGLTVIVVNKDTMRFNRLTNLNLLPSSTMDPQKPPESHQFFAGRCMTTS
ncbi:MAG: hypothetical protein V7731_08190 [Amphritea sp.]